MFNVEFGFKRCKKIENVGKDGQKFTFYRAFLDDGSASGIELPCTKGFFDYAKVMANGGDPDDIIPIIQYYKESTGKVIFKLDVLNLAEDDSDDWGD